MHAANANRFEVAARTLKVHNLVTAIYNTFRPTNAFEAGALVATLRATSQKDRDTFAKLAGVRSPSATTWDMVCRDIVDNAKERKVA